MTFCHLDNNRREQVRDAVVTGQLNPFGVNQHQAQVIRGVMQKHAGENGIDTDRFTGTCCAGNEQVWHDGQICANGMARDILSEGKR